jgi:hypothetical protein
MVLLTEAWLLAVVEKQQVGPFKSAELLKKLTHLKLEDKQVGGPTPCAAIRSHV